MAGLGFTFGASTFAPHPLCSCNGAGMGLSSLAERQFLIRDPCQLTVLGFVETEQVKEG